MLLALTLSLAQATPPTTEEGAAVFSAWAEHAALTPPPLRSPAPPRGSADFLTGWQRDNLFILQDVDGAWFADAITQVASGGFNAITNSLVDAFYASNSDDYDYVCILLIRDFSLFFAFYQPIANDTKGIGYDSITPGEIFDQDPSNSLDGLIFMNYEGLWSQNYEAGRYVFGQEFGHRWGAFTNISNETLGSEDLLGRDVAHWSYWYATGNSPMEGNTWIDNGDGTWSTDYQGTSTYSDLDLYLMGFIPPTDVGPQTFLQVSAEEQTRVGLEPASSPNYFNCTVDPNGCENTTVAATPVSFGVDSIVAAEGVRNPDDTSSQRTFKMAFIVLALQGDDTSDETLDRVDALRQTWETDWESDARGLADLDTTLGQSSAPEWGTEIPDTAGEDTGVDSALPDDSSPVADNETPKAEEPGGCGCAAGQPVGLLGGLLGVAALLRRRRSA